MLSFIKKEYHLEDDEWGEIHGYLGSEKVMFDSKGNCHLYKKGEHKLDQKAINKLIGNESIKKIYKRLPDIERLQLDISNDCNTSWASAFLYVQEPIEAQMF